MTQEIDQKRIAAIKGQTTRMQSAVEAIEIVDAASMAEASDLRSRMKQYERAMAKEKKTWLDPINLLRNKVFGAFRPFEAQVAEGIKAVDTKIIAYQNKIEAEARAKEAKLQARIDKGTIKPETAMRQMEEAPTPDSMVTGQHGKTVIQERRDAVVEDAALIPREYLLPDMVLIRQKVLNEGVAIPGIKIVTNKVLSSR